jgi:RNA polymerase sigma factor (sigma-70 family)
MERVRGGNPEAARELFDEYGGHVRRIVRRKLDMRLRTQFDSTDFTQAVWASFFATPADHFAFATPNALVAFLAGMAFNKVAEAYRNRVHAAKRDIMREQPLPTNETGESVGPSDPRQATPSQEAVANEQWERLLEGQPSHYRLALEMLRRGHTHAETAARLGLNPKQIQRLLQKLHRDPVDHE